MSTVTTRLGLVKPTTLEQYALSVLNNNMDTIDQFQIDFNDKLPRGTVGEEVQSGTTGGFTSTDTLVNSCTVNLIAGRRYEVMFSANVLTTATTQVVSIVIRKSATNDLGATTGTILTSGIQWDTSGIASVSVSRHGRVEFTASATETQLIKATAKLASGATSTQLSFRALHVRDMGANLP